MTAELWRLSASHLARLLAAREASSQEIVRAHLDRIAAVDGTVRAFTAVFRERALAEATRADEARRRGDVVGPLHGLPVSFKECFDMEGLPTTLGLTAWRGTKAPADAAMVRLLRSAGAIVLGRTNLSQTMLFGESRNPVYGQTSNPFSAAHSPGGSSGGEAAAVAAGMSPLGIGTDIGGSIRTPCHFSGICGLKPTLDRLPTKGMRTVLAGQEIVRSMCGPMARTVEDLALFMRALDARAMGAFDSRVPPVAWEDPAAVVVAKLRVGIYADDGMIPPSRAVIRGVERAGEALRARGCEVSAFVPPGSVDAIYDYLAALSSDGARTMIGALAGGEIDVVMKPLVRLAGLPAPVRRAIARGLSIAGEERMARMLFAMGEKRVADVWKLTDALRTYRARVLDAMDAAKLDLVLCPAYATPAVPHTMTKNFTLASSYAILWNITQFPAGVVPVTRVRDDEAERDSPRDALEKHARKIDRASAGLPIGVQVVGRPWAEATVLAAMAAIEEAVRGDEGFPSTPVDGE